MSTNPYYHFSDINQPVIELVVAWMCNDPGFLKSPLIQNQPSLTKGLGFIGNPGTGKSLLMKAMAVASKRLFDKEYAKRFTVKYCDAIEVEYSHAGPDSITKYRNQKADGFLNSIALDELGYESPVKWFGNDKKEVLSDVIMVRDRLFTDHGIYTHFTSNLGMDELAERYGDRADSRLYGMCNIIYLGEKAEAIDYRKYKF